MTRPAELKWRDVWLQTAKKRLKINPTLKPVSAMIQHKQVL